VTAATRGGDQQVPLDYTRIPTVAAGFALAAKLDRQLWAIAKSALSDGEGQVLLFEHLPLLSFINRAVSLHRAIVAMIEQENPHATFTLMRAYLELVVLVYYVNGHPEYMRALERPARDLPPGVARRSMQAMINVAAKDMAGIRVVYARLSEMGHFGSTALWQAFAITDSGGGPGTLHYRTHPHWKREGDDRMALAMLIENDEAMLVLLEQQAARLTPAVEAAIAVQAEAAE
jgi:hypothetical protein